MEFYKSDIAKKARELREKGIKTSQIIKETGATKAAILRWCSDMPSNNPYHLKHLKIKELIKDQGKRNVDGLVIDKNNAKIFLSLIYWCEGYKYPGCNCVGFSNSDINLIKTFLELFRIGFNPEEKRLKAHLQLHTTHDKKEITSFWSKALKIPENQFQRPTITVPQAKMKRMDYKGTCTIRYYDVKLFNEILGIYQGFFEKVK
jgi:predicted transcriptional regulator